jgi:hypothetical protein
MKTNYFNLKVALFLMCSLTVLEYCTAQDKKAPTTPVAPLNPKSHSFVSDVTSNPAHIISRDAAANYIYNYTRAFTGYATTANYGAWTEIDAKTFTIDTKDTYTGLIFWFYFNDAFKIAYSKKEGVEQTQVMRPLSLIDVNEKYFHSFCTGVFTMSEIASKKSISDKLAATTFKCADFDINNKVLGLDLVANNKNYTNEFKNKINAVNTADETIQKSCYYPAGWIFNEQLDALIHSNNVPVAAVRIYWGYDSSVKEADNRLRIILVGVDSDGKNIWDETAVILERSWPPDVN